VTQPPESKNGPESLDHSQPDRGRTNRWAVAAVITGTVGLSVPAIGLAVAALVQTGRRGGKGRGLAVAALVMSGAWLTAAAVLLSVTAGNGEDRAPETGGPRASALSAEDCFIGFTGPPKDLLLRYAGPDELEWARGQRHVVCLVTSRKGRLSRSLVPELERS
jgi:hypothetical protein